MKICCLYKLIYVNFRTMAERIGRAWFIVLSHSQSAEFWLSSAPLFGRRCTAVYADRLQNVSYRESVGSKRCCRANFALLLRERPLLGRAR